MSKGKLFLGFLGIALGISLIATAISLFVNWKQSLPPLSHREAQASAVHIAPTITVSTSITTSFGGCTPPTIFVTANAKYTDYWVLLKNDSGKQWLFGYSATNGQWNTKLVSGEFGDVRGGERAILTNGLYVIFVIRANRPDMNSYPTDQQLEKMDILEVVPFRVTC